MRREGRRRTKVKIRKKSFLLRRRNEYGTFTWSEGRMTKTTSLYREMSARVRLRLALDHFSDLKRRGMLRWEAYKKHRVSINTALRTIGEAIMRLRKRRVEAGLFYLVPQADRPAIQVRTHLFSMPLKEAPWNSKRGSNSWTRTIILRNLPPTATPSPLCDHR